MGGVINENIWILKTIKKREKIKCGCNMTCSKCDNKMIMFGITESGHYKYYCEKCYNIQINHTKSKISH